MAEPISSALLTRVAASLLSNKKSREILKWIVFAIISPLILAVVILTILLQGGAEHNRNAIDFAFNNKIITGNIPFEYISDIENIREKFLKIDEITNEVNKDIENIGLDSIRVKAVFYALFYLENIDSVDINEFVNCFYYSEERIKTETIKDEYGVEYSYEVECKVNIPYQDLLKVYSNINENIGKEVSDIDIINANKIYELQTLSEDFELEYINIKEFVAPVDNWKSSVTSEFGMRYHPITYEYTLHNGIDIAKSKGTEIYAVLDGVVTVSSFDEDGYGAYIKISHDFILETVYGHCSKLLVEEGQEVKAGDVIAEVGTTGMSTGNHLHFEIIEDGENINPRVYLPR